MYYIYAENKKTHELMMIGETDTLEQARWEIDNNIEWDDDDIPEDWTFKAVYAEEDVEDTDDEWDLETEVGFDPYMGCYTDECQSIGKVNKLCLLFL